MTTKIVCGLGNPGREYESHRHNVGFHVVERLASRLGIGLNSEKFDARLGQGNLGTDRVLLLEPQTFMNDSGRSLAGAARFYKVISADILVIHDELDLPFGRIQLKQGGGAGGHNGLRSILEQWSDDGFARLRFGVDKPQGPNAKERVVGHVLSGFSSPERVQLPALEDLATDAVEAWLKEGLAKAMNAFNRRAPSP